MECDTFNQAYPQLVRKVLQDGALVPSRVAPTKELHPVFLEVRKPLQRLVTAPGRPINVAFALAEVLWILSGRNDVEMLAFYNKRISDYSDDGTTFNAAYGYRLRHEFGHDQLADIVRTLELDPGSRQAVLQMWSPQRDRGWKDTGQHQTKDRACNVLSHLMVRDGALDWLQVVRSNDLLWGSPYNWMQFTHLQEYVATRLGIPVGRYWHLADSLHIYDYHFEEAESIAGFDLYKELEWEHTPMRKADRWTMADVCRLEETSRSFNVLDSYACSQLPRYWQHVLMLLRAHTFYRRGQDFKCYVQLCHFDNDRVYTAAQLRFYYHWRWSKEEIPQIEKRIDNEFPKAVASWIRGS